MSYGQDAGLQPPPPLNFGFPSPGSYGALDSPTLGSSIYSPNPALLPPPPADILDENYRSAVADGYSDRNGKPRTSPALDQNDAVVMHLLVETAVGDSLSYEILSFEELEALKKERVSLTSRMEAAGQKLALETKMRDAAQSLNRLSASKNRRGSNGSQASNGSNPADSAAKGEAEYTASAQKCDELGRELWEMERRFRQIDMQLLRHTAGILQMTHKGPTKRGRSRQSVVGGNRPDSPASMYTYENAGARSPVQYDDKDAFDDRSLYRSPENLDKLVDALKHGKALGNGDGDSPVNNDTLQSVESRLEDLNDRLRQLIIQTNPDANNEYDAGPKDKGEDSPAQRASNIAEKLDYLDQGLRDMEAAQHNMGSKSSVEGLDGRLENVNNQLYQIISRAPRENAEEFPPPPTDGAQDQLNYVEDALYAIEQSQQDLLSQLDQARNADTSELTAYWKEQASEYETVCQQLWDLIRAGHEEARQRKLQRRRVLEADPDAVSDLGELSPDEDPMPEEFTLNRFSNQVQDMYRRSNGLKEKQSILRRQIKQQRELNEKSDAEREEQFERLHGEIDRLRHQLHANSSDSGAAGERVVELETALAEAEDKVAELAHNFENSKAREEEAASAIEQKEQQLAKTTNELHDLETKVVQLQTELTIAQAELDGAYGTRAQRAAEVASNPEIKRELEDLARINADLTSEVARLTEAHAGANRSAKDVVEREKMLREELRDTIAEFEEMTKANVEGEKERESLEGVIDNLREKIEGLEAQLSDEKMRWLGVKSPAAIPTPGAPNGGVVLAETTSTKVLREEFRKMMRETRLEAMKAMRVSSRVPSPCPFSKLTMFLTTGRARRAQEAGTDPQDAEEGATAPSQVSQGSQAWTEPEHDGGLEALQRNVYCRCLFAPYTDLTTIQWEPRLCPQVRMVRSFYSSSIIFFYF